MNVNDLLALAIRETDELMDEEDFLVRDLFKGYIWNRIDKSSRLRLGVLFLNEATSRRELGIEVLGKTSANQQKYRKRKSPRSKDLNGKHG